MSRQTRASVNTCIVLGVSSAGSERIDFGRGGARRCRGRSLRWSAACVRALGFKCSAAAFLAVLNEAQGGRRSDATAAKLMLYTNGDTNESSAFRAQRLGNAQRQ